MLFYDLHIHSCLSPCGNDDMTPHNICAMAHIKGLDVISVTDHNTAGNLRAVSENAKKYNVLFLPGIELNTKEEVHLLGYFNSVDNAEGFSKYCDNYRQKIKNSPEYFGRQYYMDSEDNILSEEESLLISPLKLSFEEAVEGIRNFGGVPVPAHVFRSNGIINMLGFIPPDSGIKCIEVNGNDVPPKGYNILRSSDAHTLGDISEPIFSLDCDNNIASILACLERKA